jgi:hypothetical protein
MTLPIAAKEFIFVNIIPEFVDVEQNYEEDA